MILVYFRWPQPVDSATNRTVPICPQSRVSVLFCSLTSPALDRSAPNRGSPGGGGESPQASSIRRPLAGVSDVCQISSDSVRCMQFAGNTRPAPSALPVRTGQNWSTVAIWLSQNAVLELPRRSHDASRDAFCARLYSNVRKIRLREHFGPISEPSKPGKHCESAVRVIVFKHVAVFASGRLRAS